MSGEISRTEAWNLLCEWTKGESLRRHALAVEAAMRAYAGRFGEDEELWGATGLLHDLDYERYPSLEDGHPRYAMRELEAKGYIVLTRSPEAGVDMFARDDGHLALFFQGHPEYDGDTLAREFRRDVMRAVHEGGNPPEPPAGFYPPEVETRLRAQVAGMLAGAETPHLPAEAMVGPEASWRRRGGVVISNWLTAIAARKAAAKAEIFSRARWGG